MRKGNMFAPRSLMLSKTNEQNGSNEQNESKQETDKPKSNDDFRKMFLQ